MVWALRLWGAVLPALVLLLLVRWVADALRARATARRRRSPSGSARWCCRSSTLLFSHVFTACLGFAAFALLLREREGPASLLRLCRRRAGLIGYAITPSTAAVRRASCSAIYAPARASGRASARRSPTRAGVVAGVVPLALYDKWAYGSFTHVAYADLPRHQSGFFGIRPPSLDGGRAPVLDSRGLLTLSPVLSWARSARCCSTAAGTAPRRSRSRRSCCCYLALQRAATTCRSAAARPGPRFLTTMLPFLAVPLALAWRRFPAQTLALAGISVVVFVLATVTHPLIGYETETVTWTRYLASHLFQPSIVSLFNGTRGWEAPLPFLVLAVAAIVLGVRATPRLSLSLAGLGTGAALAAAWAAVAILVPTGLGIDHRALENTYRSGDAKALHLPWGRWPLTHLGLAALGAALATLALAAVLSRRPRSRRARVTVAVDRV